MTRPEVDLAIDWAGAEGWNPGLHDADCFYAADPTGFLVGLVDDEPVATISVVKYGDTFGFLGLYIVKPEYRGRGYGIGVWNAGLEYLRGRSVGLDGVVAQQANYRKSGFVLAHRNVRYQGKSAGRAAFCAEIRRLSTLTRELLAYDLPFFPSGRTDFLACWIRQPDSHALGYVNDGRFRGYGVARPCRTGYKIGPLFADTPEIAEKVFVALQGELAEGSALFIDPPMVNADAVAMAERHGMKPVFETARMYAGKAPELPLDRTYGVTTFELG